MAIADRKEMLVEGLAHIRSQNEVVLIFFIGIMHTEPLSRRICKPCNNIVFDYLSAPIGLVFLYPEWATWRVLDPIIIVDSLIGET